MVEEPITENLVRAVQFIRHCPFCASHPNILAVRDDRYVKGELNWVIECANMGCIFRRSSPDRSLEHLLEEWNKWEDTPRKL